MSVNMSKQTIITKIKQIDVKAVIETLKNIDVEDLKNIDSAEIKDFLQSHLEAVINITLIIATFLFVLNIAGGHKKKLIQLRKDMKEVQENVEAVTVLKEVQKKKKVFVNNFPKVLSREKLIDSVSNFAAHNSVQILAFSPMSDKSDKFAKITRVKINVSSSSYANIVRFIYEIENTSDSIQIKEVEWKPNKDEKDQSMNVNLIISSVKLEK